jgi:hypothetical protein
MKVAAVRFELSEYQIVEIGYGKHMPFCERRIGGKIIRKEAEIFGWKSKGSYLRIPLEKSDSSSKYCI